MTIRHLLASTVLYSVFLAGSCMGQDTIKKYDLKEVVVTAFRTKSNLGNLPHSIQVLKKKDIECIPSKDLGDILKKTAGMDIVEYPGLKSNIGMRGFAPDAHGSTYTMVLLNGMPVGTQNISTIDLQMAQQIEILKGPFSAFFGSGAMAGIVNIVTPVTRGKLTGNVGIVGGTYGTGQATVNMGGSLGKKLNFDLYAKGFTQQKDFKTGSRNILKMTDLEKEIMDSLSYNKPFLNSSYNKYNAGFRLGWDISKNWQVSLFEDLFLANDVLMNGTFWGIYGQQQKDLQRLSQSMIITGKEGRHSMRFSPYFINDKETYFNDLSEDHYITNVNNANTYGFIIQDEVVLDNHTLVFGIDNKSDRYTSKQWLGRSNPGAPYQPDNTNMATGAFFQYRISLLNNKLNLSTGARYDLISFKIHDTEYMDISKATEIYNTVNPNFGIQYSIIPGLKLHTSAGTAFLAPDAFKKTGTYSFTSTYGAKVYRGNPELKPESSQSVDFGLSFSKRKLGLSADITLFASNHRGMIVYDYSNHDTTTFINSDNGKMSGLEGNLAFDCGVFADYRFSLKLYTNFTHLFRAEFQTGGQISDMKYVRKNNASFGIQFENFKGFTTGLNARYIGHRLEDNWLYMFDYSTNLNVPFTTQEGFPIRQGLINTFVLEHPDFLVIDFSCSYMFMRRWKIGVEIQNLTDENYTEKDSFYMPGRMIFGNLTYQF